MGWGSIRRDKADAVFSTYIRKRANWTCERCGKYGGEGSCEVSHFHGRRHENTRYDVENVFCLCHSCHRFFTENPHDHSAWVMKRLGHQRYTALVVRANTYKKKDRAMELIKAKALLNSLD